MIFSRDIIQLVNRICLGGTPSRLRRQKRSKIGTDHESWTSMQTTLSLRKWRHYPDHYKTTTRDNLCRYACIVKPIITREARYSLGGGIKPARERSRFKRDDDDKITSSTNRSGVDRARLHGSLVPSLVPEFLFNIFDIDVIEPTMRERYSVGSLVRDEQQNYFPSSTLGVRGKNFYFSPPRFEATLLRSLTFIDYFIDHTIIT